MQGKLQELTEKIYQEGISKGNEEAEKIISEAKAEAEKIVSDAKKEAESIISGAEKKSKEISDNTQTEIRLTSKQVINTVKQKITDLLSNAVVEDNIKSTLSDKEFIAAIIKIIAEKWNPNTGGSIDLNIILPEDSKADMDSYIKKNAADVLKKGLDVKFESTLESGFQIAPKDGGYKISFSEKEFNNFFKEYIRPKLAELLFDTE